MHKCNCAKPEVQRGNLEGGEESKYMKRVGRLPKYLVLKYLM
jgi:hypothetical protein